MAKIDVDQPMNRKQRRTLEKWARTEEGKESLRKAKRAMQAKAEKNRSIAAALAGRELRQYEKQ